MNSIHIPDAMAEAIARLDKQAEGAPEMEAPKIAIQDEPNIYHSRILEGLEVASAFADRLDDADYAQAVRDKLTRSNVRGSRIEGIKTIGDVKRMLESITDWGFVTSNLKDKTVECVEGTLPPEYANRAFAAYASIRDIAKKFGQSGLGTIQVKPGNQKEDEFYLCTMLRVPTDIITVQLKKEVNGAGYEYLHQWFAGPELTSLLRIDEGDTMVRCGVVIPLINDPRYASRHKGPNRHSAN